MLQLELVLRRYPSSCQKCLQLPFACQTSHMMSGKLLNQVKNLLWYSTIPFSSSNNTQVLMVSFTQFQQLIKNWSGLLRNIFFLLDESSWEQADVKTFSWTKLLSCYPFHTVCFLSRFGRMLIFIMHFPFFWLIGCPKAFFLSLRKSQSRILLCRNKQKQQQKSLSRRKKPTRMFVHTWS